MRKKNGTESIFDQLTPITWQKDVASHRHARFSWGCTTSDAAAEVLTRAAHTNQIHGNLIANASSIHPTQRPEADGVYATEPGIVVAVKTADCMPVLFCADGSKTFAMAIHAGWRGFCSGILEGGMQQAILNGINPSDLQVVIGPTISAQHFEIGPEVLAALIAHSGEEKTAFFTHKGVADRWHADLQTGAVLELLSLGIQRQKISVVRICTYASEFPSYRREGKGCGRIVSWVETKANKATT